VAGVGNIFLSDDGFGVEVVRRLAGDVFPDDVRVADYGIRGVHLAYELLEGYQTTILIDATPRGGTPGTVYVIEPDLESIPAGVLMDAHSLDPATVFGMLKALGGTPEHVLVVGCEPASVEDGIGLSEPVERAVDEAVQVVRGLIAESCGQQRKEA
jgi:hydrogenase maturation protease